MSQRFFLHPQHLFTVLDDIDSSPPSYTLTRQASLRRVFWTLACVSVSLLMIHYLKYFTALKGFLAWLSQAQGLQPNYWLIELQKAEYFHLIKYCWWTFWHVIGYVLLPFLVIRFLLKTPFAEMGWHLNETRKHWRGYVLLVSPILLFVFLVSFRQDFIQHYPFYPQAGRSVFDLVAWECLYLTQFVCLEFFFRGFMINALRPAIGANAIWVMCVPYLMIHFPKLWLEATGAILFGLFLGILALRSRSIWGGFAVHAGIAISMDVASLLRQGLFPNQFWP